MSEKAKEGIEFTKQLGRFVVAAAFLGLSGYAIYSGKHSLSVATKSTLLLFAGLIVGAYGLVELYKTLMRKV